MNKKYALLVLAVLALMLNACTRAASSVPLATASPDPNFPVPLSTSAMSVIEIAGTQTAVATAGLPMPTAGAGTQAPVANATFTPLAGINLTPIVNTPLPSPTTVSAVPAGSTPVPAPAVNNPGTYSLHEGEFPYCLARRFNVDPDELLALNGLSSGQSYYTPGTVIKIPQSGKVFPGVRALIAHPAQYTVRAGDTAYSIACKFGDVDPSSIPAGLTAGSVIQIP